MKFGYILARLTPTLHPKIKIGYFSLALWEPASWRKPLPMKNRFVFPIIVLLFALSPLPAQEKYSELQEIKGNITSLENPLPDVNVSSKNSARGTKTDDEGHYRILAQPGETLTFSYVGLQTVEIIVEDVTTVLNIEMIAESNELQEVLVTGKTSKGHILEREEKRKRAFTTPDGKFARQFNSWHSYYVDGADILPGYSSLTFALRGKIPGFLIGLDEKTVFLRGINSIGNGTPAQWELDGQLFDSEPFLDITQIRDIHVIKTPGAITPAGNRSGGGGIIMVRTTYGSFDNTTKNPSDPLEQFYNQRVYDSSAIAFDSSLKFDKSDIENIFKEKEAVNPEILKAQAYFLESVGQNEKAIDTYKEVFRLRPEHAQSYRDLANAYRHNGQYQRAWHLYMSYLMQGNTVQGEGIGQTLYNEMEWLFFNRKESAGIKEVFVPLNATAQDFSNDVRLVFEWNTSEAEFDLEFVNPEMKSYVFEHTLATNAALIADEKTIGYSSKEFTIDDLGMGEWLVNIAYFGNKKPAPTIIKMTAYFNWGSAEEFRETHVFKLDKEDVKVQLLKLNEQLLFAQR